MLSDRRRRHVLREMVRTIPARHGAREHRGIACSSASHRWSDVDRRDGLGDPATDSSRALLDGPE